MESLERESTDNEQKAENNLVESEIVPDTVDIDEINTENVNESSEDLQKINNDNVEKDENLTEAHGFDEDDDSDEDDDTYNIIIKPPNAKNSIYKTGVTYQARSQGASSQHQKVTRQGVNMNDPGNVNGSATIDFNLDTLGDEEKPWKHPGADITDYFNYGFTEDTWTQYCEKQKILRQEYANASLKPVVIGTAAGMGLTGLSIAQRNRFVGLPGRSYDSYNNKSSNAGNINVINLSSNPQEDSDDEDEGKSENEGSVFNGSSRGFAVPPPGYGNDQSAAALSQLNVVSAFNIPPPGFSNSNLSASVLNTGSLFPRPTGQHSSQAGWSSSNVRSGLISLLTGPAVRSTTGRSNNEHRGRTPENLFSDDEYQDNRRSSRYHGEEESEDRYNDRYDRDQHRSNQRSRSRSRDRRYSSRNRRHHDESSSSRDYSNRHVERSSHRRSRDNREHRSDRTSGGGGNGTDFLVESSSRDRSHRHRESRRLDHRPSGGSSSSSRQQPSKRNRGSDFVAPVSSSSKHRGRSSQSPLSPIADNPKHNPEVESTDPLAAASAAAANIASRIKLNDSLLSEQNFV